VAGKLDPNQLVEKDALYYPYIHIRSVDWLKRALLVFPHVARIVPRYYVPQDRGELREFEGILGRWNKPLLREANLNSSGVRQAQSTLLDLLSDDLANVPGFRERYSRAAIGNSLPHKEFLLHRDKPTFELVDFLSEHGLMWRAEHESPSAFTAVHPVIGEAIMSTIAMACARDEGFDVVTDEGRVHHDISGSDVAGLYHSLTRGGNLTNTKHKATTNKLCELLIFQQCDVAKLTAARLAELSKDHEAIDAFRSALAGLAEKIPEMQSATAFEDRLRAAVDDALRAWQQNKLNMSNVSKEIFGKDLLKPTEGFMKSLVDKFTATALGAAAGGAGAGPVGILVGAAGGFVVALIVHGASSWIKASEHERSSPFRYLTQIEKAGVTFTMTR
jgi:hypothetical protein